MVASIAAPDRNNADSPNASGPNSLDVMGEASIDTPSASVVPPAKVKTLSANAAVPFSISGVAATAFSEESFSMAFQSVSAALK